MEGTTTLDYMRPLSDVASLARQLVREPKNFRREPSANPLSGKYALAIGEDFSKHFAKLAEIAVNPALWATGAPSPSPASIAWAESILQHLQNISLPPTRIVASADGGIAICFIVDNRYADLEILNTGEILGIVSNRIDRPDAWEVDEDARGISRAAMRIRQFLK